jgi:hypothetical protein
MLRSAEIINKRKLELDETCAIRNYTAALDRSATRLPTLQPLFHVDKDQYLSLVWGYAPAWERTVPEAPPPRWRHHASGFTFINRYSHVGWAKHHRRPTKTTTRKPKHSPRPLFLTSDPKIIFHHKPLFHKDLQKSEKNSLAKSRFLLYTCVYYNTRLVPFRR